MLTINKTLSPVGVNADVVVDSYIYSYRTWCELALKRSPLEHCISRPVPPQHPQSLL